MKEPYRMRIDTVVGPSVPDDVVLLSSVMHTRAIVGPPWNMQLPVGVPSDPPAGETTVCAYLNMFRSEPTSCWLLIWEEDENGQKTLAGFTCGAVFNQFLLTQTKMHLGADPTPCVGDYYFALTTIQGPEAPNGKNFRGRKIDGRSLFGLSVAMLVSWSNEIGCNRFWVRTHAEELKVQKVAADIGCDTVHRQSVMKAGVETARVVMMKPRCGLSLPRTLVGDWFT